MHIPIPSSLFFTIMGAISMESMQRSATQLVAKAKRPRQESTLTQQEGATFRATKDVVFASQPSYTLAPSSSSGVEASLTTIMDQLHLMRVDFGSLLDYLSNEMCLMSTRIGRIARQ